MNESHTESDQSLLEEIDVLKAILFSEIDVTYTENGRPTQLLTTLYPSTAHDANQQYVCLTLIMKFPPEYPLEKPVIELRNPRGLGEDFLANVFKQCQEKCKQFSGCPVIYEIIELIRESLTNSNKPTGHCTICLFEFHSEDVFTYTPCYHHFHSHCLFRFCKNLQRQWKEEGDQEAAQNPNGALMKEKKPRNFTCPVCREAIYVDLEVLEQAPPPYEVVQFKEEFQADEKFRQWKREMEEAYQKQKAKGGIIDREAEDNRFLVVTDTPSNGSSTGLPSGPSIPSNEEQPQQREQQQSEPVPAQQPKEALPDTKQPTVSSNPHHQHPRPHKQHYRDQRQHHGRDHRQHYSQKFPPNQHRPQKPQQAFQERPKPDHGQVKPKREPPEHNKSEGQQTEEAQQPKPAQRTDTKQPPQGSGPQLMPLQPHQTQSNHCNQRPRQRNHRHPNDNIDRKEEDHKQERPRTQRGPNDTNRKPEVQTSSAIPTRPNFEQESSVHGECSVKGTSNANGMGQSVPRSRPPPGFAPR